MRKGDFIALVVPDNGDNNWPLTGLIVNERYLPARVVFDDFQEIPIMAYDILWDDGTLTRGVDAHWLSRYYYAVSQSD